MVAEKHEIVLKGVPASAGIVEGHTIVIPNAKEQGKMIEGGILVIPFSTPPFIPSIIKSSGIITDKGGIMTHAAIIAREFGIPCVTGTEVATKKLKDYMEVIVDGTKGYVFRK